MPLDPRYLDYLGLTGEPGAGEIPMTGPALRSGMSPLGLGQPSHDEQVNAMLGIEAPQLDTTTDPSYAPGPLDSFLERFSAGGVPQGLQNPQGFWQGLVSGAATGAVGRGRKVADTRAKLEATSLKRQAERDQANREATAKYNERRGTAMRDEIKAIRDEKKDREKYNRENPPLSQAMLDQAPWLGRAFSVGENVPSDVYQSVIKSMSPEAVAEFKRKEAGEVRAEKASANDARRLGIQEADLGLKRAEAGKPGAGKPPTEYQARAEFFRSRAKEAADGAVAGGLEGRVLNKALSLLAPPALQGDPDVRPSWRAMESFSLALNRLESGAAIAPTEFAKVRQLYFVAPGDKPADIVAKKKARENIVDYLSKMQAPGAQSDQAAPASVTPAQLWEP